MGLIVVIGLVKIRRNGERTGAPRPQGASVVKTPSPNPIVYGLSHYPGRCGDGFLVLAGAPLWTTGQSFFRLTPGEAALERIVGTSTVGFGTCPAWECSPIWGFS